MVAIKLDEHGVTIYRDDVDDWLRCDPSDFRAACCRDLGLVDPSVVTDGRAHIESWQSDGVRAAVNALWSKLTGKSKAAEVLAAASRRLA